MGTTKSNGIIDDGSFKAMDRYAEWLQVVASAASGPLNTFTLHKVDLQNLDLWLAEVIASSMSAFLEHYEEATKSKAMRKHKRLYRLALSYSNAGGARAQKKFPRALAKTFRTLWY